MEIVVILLSLLLFALLFGVGRKRGVRALLSLILTISLFIWVIIPLIIRGFDPVIVVLMTAIPILALVIYLAEGFNVISHTAIVATVVTFALTSLLVAASVSFAHLTGMTDDVSSFVGASGIDLQKLLAAGIMLGTLGVLTEMNLTQVATVFEFSQSHADMSVEQIRRQAYNVGMAHLNSIIMTLFLVYAGVSLPLLVIFMGEHGSLFRALHYEPLADEIIRTLVGTIGLVVAMPISTIIAVWWIKKSAKRCESGQ
jgi:uncharacterized membrane protein